ncbi:uncharacterized protein LOC131643052 isoform X2 [Vicia villosa]|uniref:uncharacterized protein LOC131643052 isoform X2 n=1 Tax=Vicia villosa TaxID=3911 RepID=UPI00273BBBD2|nr:uncharacterized protein LOC131643052 isoform X2 [Vicia villosa]
MQKHDTFSLWKRFLLHRISISRAFPDLPILALVDWYDLHSGIIDQMGNHNDIATCIGYSNETCLLITSGFDNKLLSWDVRTKKASLIVLSFFHVFSLKT